MTEETAATRPTSTGRIPVQRLPHRGHGRRLTPEERVAAGKAVRHAVPLDAHSEIGGADEDVLTLLRVEDRGRVPELLPIRYGRMLATPFTFYRGAASVMAADLASVPSTGLRTQLCGDAHLSNFGVFATPERRLVFDVNDFDETLPGPFEWDVKRLAASMAVAGRNNGHKRRERERTILATVGSYRKAMRKFAAMGNLAVWYASLDIEQAVEELAPRVRQEDRQRTQAALQKARTRDNADALRKLTRKKGGHARFISDPPLIVPISELFSEIHATVVWERLHEVLDSYRETLANDRRHLLDQYELVDVARKVVGVGSVGTRSYVLLLAGRDDSDPLVLQGKEAGPSALAPYCGPSPFGNDGERVVRGQRLIQAASDIFLGWERNEAVDGGQRDFYVRQLRDGKASADVDDMDPRRLAMYGELCAWTLARAHARSGDRVAIAGYLGKKPTFDHAVHEYAEAYANRTEQQYHRLVDAVEQGELAVARGV